MKSFFKSLLASILGCIIGGFILLSLVAFISMIFLAGLSSLSSSETYITKTNSVLSINLSGDLVDRYETDPLREYFEYNQVKKSSMVDILNAIKKSEADDNIKGIYINTNFSSGSAATYKEIRDALIKFKDSGKFIVAYSDMYSQNGYYVSSVADKVFMNPQGMLDIHGYAVNPMFYKSLLDKLGVEMQIFKVGTYKSAVEPFIETQMSDANREQMESILNSMWTTYKDEVAIGRNIQAPTIDKVANEGLVFLPSDSTVSNKLIDELKYEVEAKAYIKELLGLGESDKLEFASVADINNTISTNKVKNDRIAIVYAEGDITSGSGKEGITDGRYVKILDDLKNDDKVKAVVLRVNSGGGSAFASEQIWKAVTDLKSKKPIVVSMGGYAASGGYYISCNASKIIAQPNTVTGSIGIFGMVPNLENLTGKIGVNVDVVKTNTYADLGNLMRPMREDEKRLLQSNVERGYDLFLQRCADGRGKTTEEINEIGQGRVWTGQQALELGLVDQLGGLDTAVAEAAILASISDYSLQSYPKKETFLESILNSTKGGLVQSSLEEYFGSNYGDIKMLLDMNNQDHIQARLPYMTIE